MNKITWRLEGPGYRVKHGDVLVVNGERPEDVAAGEVDGGYVITGYAGYRASSLIEDYDEADEAEVWSKHESEGLPMKFLPDKRYSSPLPLP